MIRFGIVTCLSLAALAQNTAPLDPRIPVSTLIREDAFAGFLSNDMDRLAKAEKTIAQLLKERPKSRPALLAWEASTKAYRAVRAHEEGKTQEFGRYFGEALLLFADAEEARGNVPDTSVAAITGGTFVVLGDRVPEQYRKASWGSAYRAYQFIWKMQSAEVEKLPPHLKGELLAGLALTAQRTGKTEEAALHLDRMIAMLPGTPYESAAKKWKEDPAAASNTRLACLTCHSAGRLEPVRAKLSSATRQPR